MGILERAEDIYRGHGHLRGLCTDCFKFVSLLGLKYDVHPPQRAGGWDSLPADKYYLSQRYEIPLTYYIYYLFT